MPTKPWRHSSSSVISLFSSFHVGDDVIAPFGEDIQVGGKFAYGAVSKDLENEEIELYVDRCSSEAQLLATTLTNDDGRTGFVIRASEIKTPGVYRIYQRVSGDDTWLSSTLRVLPRETHLAVFDIDGTLTLSDSEMTWSVIRRMISSNYDPVARRGAREVTQAWHDAGREVVYLSGRHYVLTNMTREWLQDKDMAAGTILVGQSIGEVMTNNTGVGIFKLGHLNKLQAAGFIVDAAYGNATTDIYAYGEAGIPKAVTYIVGEHGGKQGTLSLGNDYMQHLTEL